jgi:hypothetical protein
MKYLQISDEDYELVCNLVWENGYDLDFVTSGITDRKEDARFEELRELSDIIDELIDRGRLTAKITFDV